MNKIAVDNLYKMGFEQLLNECDIAIKIYKLLNFSDQLRLARANRELKAIFEQFIWKENYAKLAITDDDGEYVVTGGPGTSPLILEHEDFQEFLDYYADNIEDLTVYELKAMDIDDIVREFRNLSKLKYVSVQLPMTHITALSKRCRKLHNLQLQQCTMGNYGCLDVGKTLSIKTLAKLKNLRHLSVQQCGGSSMTYTVFHQVIRRLKLESFKVDCCIRPDDIKSKKQRQKSVQLKKLDIDAATFNAGIWPGKTFSWYLSNFENLLCLTVQIIDNPVTEDILDTIAKTCKNLKEFNILSTCFDIVNGFPMPPQVSELSLRNCTNLRYNNLKHLLTAVKCSKFSSTYTRYDGQMEEFDIAPSLQSLCVDRVQTKMFKSCHLKELVWHTDQNDQNVDSLISNRNLEILHIQSGLINLDSLLQLKSLYRLSFSESMSCVNWSYIIGLLRHPSLRELSIYGETYRSLLCERSEAPNQIDVLTGITTLKISFVTFRKALTFWLDLFEKNPKLKLIVNNFKNFEEFLIKFLDDDLFPRNLRTIEIWGFSMSK